jgi:hypothetical protein
MIRIRRQDLTAAAEALMRAARVDLTASREAA